MNSAGYFPSRFALLALLVTAAPTPEFAASEVADATFGAPDKTTVSVRNDHDGSSLDFLNKDDNRADDGFASENAAEFTTSAPGFNSKAWSCPSGVLAVI